MNKGIRFFVIIMLIALFGFSAASCDNMSRIPWYQQFIWKSGNYQISFYEGSSSSQQFLIKNNGDPFLRGYYAFSTTRITIKSLQKYDGIQYWNTVSPSGGTGYIYYTNSESSNTWNVTTLDGNYTDTFVVLKDKTFKKK